MNQRADALADHVALLMKRIAALETELRAANEARERAETSAAGWRIAADTALTRIQELLDRAELAEQRNAEWMKERGEIREKLEQIAVWCQSNPRLLAGYLLTTGQHAEIRGLYTNSLAALAELHTRLSADPVGEVREEPKCR